MMSQGGCSVGALTAVLPNIKQVRKVKKKKKICFIYLFV